MTVCTSASRPNWKRRRSPGLAPQAWLMASRNSGEMVFDKGDCVHSPDSPTLARARPRAPLPLANSSSLSDSARDRA